MWRWPSLRSPSPPPPWRGSSAAARLPGTGGWRATMRLGRLKSPVAFCRLLVVAVDEGEHAPLHSLSGLTSPSQVMDQPGVAHGPAAKEGRRGAGFLQVTLDRQLQAPVAPSRLVGNESVPAVLLYISYLSLIFPSYIF